MSSVELRSGHVFSVIKSFAPWRRSTQGTLFRSRLARQIHDGRNRLTNFWVPTGGIAAAESGEEQSVSLLKRAGFVRQSHSGIFHLLPLGLKVQEKLERLIDQEMRSIGASKLSLSSISSEELWERSGRLAKNPELLRVHDRRESGFILSPTHEEEITTLASEILKSYKDLPLRVYQMSRKYRDELRPRQGLLRAKEFLMKDLYTFDMTVEDALQTYEQVKAAYVRVFDRLGLDYFVAKADPGNMGGNLSHEYQLGSPVGEDTVFTCDKCDFCANEEVLPANAEAACPECTDGTLSPQRAIEVGHTFHLGTRYSEPLKATVADHSGRQAQLQMGCHGIGISRIIGAAASLLSTKDELRWPLAIAPFKIVIISDPTTQADAEAVYDRAISQLKSIDGLNQSLGIEIHEGDVVLDDRDKPLGWKLKDAGLIGYPIVLVLGSLWKKHGVVDVNLQAHNQAGGQVSLKKEELMSALQLNDRIRAPAD